MKTSILAIFAFLCTTVASAQSMDKWPALKELHSVVSQTFHPSEKGDLEPIKSRSEELMNKSAALLKSDIPADFRTNAILTSAEKLQLKTKAIHKLVVGKASDAEITKALAQAHDIFHEIVGLCTGEKHQH